MAPMAPGFLLLAAGRAVGREGSPLPSIALALRRLTAASHSQQQQQQQHEEPSADIDQPSCSSSLRHMQPLRHTHRSTWPLGPAPALHALPSERCAHQPCRAFASTAAGEAQPRQNLVVHSRRQRSGSGGGYQRHQLSPQLEGVKRKMAELLQTERVQQAVDLLRAVLHEGMKEGGAGGLPYEYRPDANMMEEYLRALTRLNRMQGMQLLDDEATQDHRARDDSQKHAQQGRIAARKYASELQEGLIFCKAAGIVPGPHVYSQLIRALRRSQQLELMEPVLSEMKARGHVPNLSCYLHLLMAHIEGGQLQTGWSQLEPMIVQEQQRAQSEPSGDGADGRADAMPSLTAAASQLLRRAAVSKALDLAVSVQRRLAELGIVVEASAYEQCMASAAASDELEVAEEFMARLAVCGDGSGSSSGHRLDRQQQQQQQQQQEEEQAKAAAAEAAAEAGSSDATPAATSSPLLPARVQEGSLLAVMHAALRASDPQAGLRVAKEAFALLERSQGASYGHRWQYYVHVLGMDAEEVKASPPGPPPTLAVPSVAAHLALMHAHVQAADWEGAFKCMHRLEQLPPSPAVPRRLLSPFHGTRAFCEALMGDEAAVAAAYDELSMRHSRGEAVTTPMLNLVLRALAASSGAVGGGDAAVEATSRLFEEFAAAGLEHDADSYNAVIEACGRANKLPAVQSLVDLMASGVAVDPAKPPPPRPNADTWDLLLKAHVGMEDCDGLLVALHRVKATNVQMRVDTLRRALALAQRLDHRTAAYQLQEELWAATERSGPRGVGSEAGPWRGRREGRAGGTWRWGRGGRR